MSSTIAPTVGASTTEIVEPGTIAPGIWMQFPGAGPATTVTGPVAPAAPVTVNDTRPVKPGAPILHSFNVDNASKKRTSVSFAGDASTITSTLLSLFSEPKIVVPGFAGPSVTFVMNTPSPVSCTFTVPAGTAIGALH